MKEVVIVAAKRTAIGSFLGGLASVSAPQLGKVVIGAVLDAAGVKPEQVDQVIMGNVLTAGVGQNPARQAAIAAGIPVSVPASTLNVVCGSGLRAVHLAAQAIATGEADIVVAGGQESMSQSAHIIQMRNGQKMGNAQLVDSMVYDGLTDVYNQYHMGMTAENIVEKLSISREYQDALALSSQQRAVKAQVEGKFDAEIVPVQVPQRKGDPLVFDRDEYIKAETNEQSLAKLRPAFKKDGTVTAGNASGINDGAAAVLVMSADKAAELGLQPLAKIKAYSMSGIEPEVMGLGPVNAVRKTLEKASWSLDEVDLVEANEAFAAQALGVAKELGLNMDKVNVNGGAIALGHPIGASGCRILVTLLHEMQRSEKKKGLATLCIGGGMGVALAVERP
ncbi:acetyl-CoA C-acetyltransferase [Acinetobacter sp. C_4_1]|uniref:acetyl-CoA C-acetyltransferase n=1 Tax=unclassified Acinetobacter TaxID=196816 RepID=UPI0021B70817|nr:MULTISPECIES: acetyl-CoA C-acetyltransferase [unclassified Acinetobacter]MCT8088220.1 acetyl-CoA C-acetyltransferase [Acinetobacter sp. F_3_1]MCT8097589.1 acetyl-CoA C-acetyltransferase [Acinetobacter sp. C_3_1]MCT8100682.1 acetyl-CoA C-acetyltransferase [Acinetobacter sp. C_4_1]MCT8134031.1 acetyl-CoA C-acetyltransferase [Acinetobacter sp. T_3_1]